MDGVSVYPDTIAAPSPLAPLPLLSSLNTNLLTTHKHARTSICFIILYYFDAGSLTCQLGAYLWTLPGTQQQGEGAVTHNMGKDYAAQ